MVEDKLMSVETVGVGNECGEDRMPGLATEAARRR